jgi:hypothetical protein
MIDVALLPLDLARWDQAEGGDLFAVLICTDVRPLRGAAGLLDWRLNGGLSACLREERFTGAAGEKLLMPTARLPWQAVLAVGVGPSAKFDEPRFRESLATVLTTARGLGQRRLALALPGRELAKIDAGPALRELTENGALSALTLIDSAAALKPLGDLLGLSATARPRAAAR